MDDEKIIVMSQREIELVGEHRVMTGALNEAKSVLGDMMKQCRGQKCVVMRIGYEIIEVEPTKEEDDDESELKQDDAKSEDEIVDGDISDDGQDDSRSNEQTEDVEVETSESDESPEDDGSTEDADGALEDEVEDTFSDQMSEISEDENKNDPEK